MYVSRGTLHLFTELFIKIWVVCVEVFLVQVILDQPQTFAKPLEVNELPLAEETDRVCHFCILCQTQDVIIGSACFLFCCHHVRTTFH